MPKFIVVSTGATRAAVELKLRELIPHAEFEFKEPTDEVVISMENESHPIGALVEAAPDSEAWFNLLMRHDVPTTCFTSEASTDDLINRFRSEDDVGSAIRLLLSEVDVATFESDSLVRKGDEKSPDDGTSNRLHLLLKDRLRCSLGDVAQDPDSPFIKHILTLVSTVNYPQKGPTASSLSDVSACLYTAQMTKRLMMQRLNVSVSAPKPHLLPPSNHEHELPIGWEGLFTILFSIVDFINSEAMEIEFKTDDTENEDDPWTLITFSPSPEFETAPLTLLGFDSLAHRYGEAINQLLTHPISDKGQPLWSWETESPKQSRLKFFSPRIPAGMAN